MNQTVNGDAAGALLRAAVDIADGCSNLGERRYAMVDCLARLTESDNGHWAWGRARPESDDLMVVGMIPCNYSDSEYAAFQEFAIDPRQQEDFCPRLQQHIHENARPDGVWSVILRHVAPDIYSTPDHWILQAMHKFGVGEWMQGGRFHAADIISVLVLGRRPGRPPYRDAERSLLDLAFTNIPWLWANPDERVPQSDVDALSPRQRAVAFLLLDGLSRKKIAGRLGISEETVNHHVKIVFQHFGVQSATELAALFLRRQ